MALSITAKNAITLNNDNSYSQKVLYTITGGLANSYVSLYIYWNDIQFPVYRNDKVGLNRLGVAIVQYEYKLYDWQPGFNQLGENTITATATASQYPNSASVDVALTLDAPPVLSDPVVISSRADGSLIEHLTDISISINAVGQFGANISYVYAYLSTTYWDALTKSGNTYSGTILSNEVPAGDYPIVFEAHDSRGQVKTLFYLVSIKKHEVPTIEVEAFRCDSSGDPDLFGGYLSVMAIASSNPPELGIDSGIDLDGDFQDNLTNGQPKIIGSGLVDSLTAYTLRFTAMDLANLSEEISITIPPVKIVYDPYDRGEGFAFGKRADKPSRLDSAWPISANGYFMSYADGLENVSRGLAVSFDDGNNADASLFVSRASYTDSNGVTRWYPRRWMMAVYSRSSATKSRLSHSERFRLPLADEDLTEDKTYDILNTKDHMKSYTISANASKSLTFASSPQFLLITIGPTAADMGAYIVYVNASGGVTYTPILTASNVTLATGSYSLQITNGDATYAIKANLLIFNGSVS